MFGQIQSDCCSSGESTLAMFVFCSLFKNGGKRRRKIFRQFMTIQAAVGQEQQIWLSLSALGQIVLHLLVHHHWDGMDGMDGMDFSSKSMLKKHGSLANFTPHKIQISRTNSH